MMAYPKYRSARSFRPGLGGFTLIELMTVVAIVGVLGSIAIANYTDAVRLSKARQQVYEVKGWIQQARNAARLTNHCIEVQKADDALELIERICGLGGTEVKTESRTFSDVDINGPSSELIFGDKGQVVSGQVVELEVAPKQEPAAKRVLYIMPVLGSVRFK